MTITTKQLQKDSNFFKLTPDKILTSAESFGFRTTGRVLQLNSMENRVFEVEIEPTEEIKSPSDKFIVMKFYRPGRWTKDQLLDEHNFLKDLESKELSVVPPLAGSDGETLKLLDEEIFYTCFKKRGGRNLDDPSPEQWRFLGRTLGRLHAIGKRRKADWRLKLTPSSCIPEACEKIYSNSKFYPELKSAFETITKRYLDLCSPWFSEAPYHRVHGDCHRGNILWVDEKPTLVDFDDMMNAPAVQDLWLLLPGRGKASEGPWNNLLEGYEQFCEFPRETSRLIEPLRFLRLVRYAAWISERWHDPIFPQTFGHYGTPAYWSGLISDLQETMQVIELGGFFADNTASYD